MIIQASFFLKNKLDWLFFSCWNLVLVAPLLLAQAYLASYKAIMHLSTISAKVESTTEFFVNSLYKIK
jgi:hypothetical protein